MSVIAAAQAVPLNVVGGPGQCRRSAISAALDEVATALAGGDEPVLALRCYQPGGLVAALGGRFDADAVDRLRGRTADLRAHTDRELVLECTHLSDHCGWQLAGVLAHLRRQCLDDGAAVHLQHAPAELLTELGQLRPDTPTADETTDDTSDDTADTVGPSRTSDPTRHARQVRDETAAS